MINSLFLMGLSFGFIGGAFMDYRGVVVGLVLLVVSLVVSGREKTESRDSFNS